MKKPEIVHKKYQIKSLLIADYKRMGEIELLQVFGYPVYHRVGYVRRYLNLFNTRASQDAT